MCIPSLSNSLLHANFDAFFEVSLSWVLMIKVALPHVILYLRSLFKHMVCRSCFYTCPSSLQLREGKEAGGKVLLTALPAATISSNTSLMSEAVKPEPWFVFENTSIICMRSWNMTWKYSFPHVSAAAEQNIWNTIQGLPISQDSGFNISLMCKHNGMWYFFTVRIYYNSWTHHDKATHLYAVCVWVSVWGGCSSEGHKST